MAVLPSCARAGEPNLAPATTCGAWLTMRRVAEYDKKMRIVEEEAQQPVLAATQQVAAK
jgi:hypothetical protein